MLFCYLLSERTAEPLNFLLIAKELKKKEKKKSSIVPVSGWISLLATVLSAL